MKQVEALKHASALLQEHDRHSHKKYDQFQQDVQQHYDTLEGNNVGLGGAQEGLQEIAQQRGNRAVQQRFDQTAADSEKKLQEIVNKHMGPKVTPWVDHTAESIAKSRKEVADTIAHMDADFFGPQPGQNTGSLLEEGTDGPAAGGSAF